MRDALKNYLALASSITEVPRRQAMAAAKALVAQGEAAAEQVGDLAEDLIETSKNNREMVAALVRSEVEKTLSRVGVATADEVSKLTRRLQSLESTLREATERAQTSSSTAGDTPPAAKPAKAAGKKPATKPAVKPAAKAAKSATKPAKAAKPAAKKAAASGTRS